MEAVSSESVFEKKITSDMTNKFNFYSRNNNNFYTFVIIYLHMSTNVQFKKTIEKVLYIKTDLQLKTKILIVKIHD